MNISKFLKIGLVTAVLGIGSFYLYSSLVPRDANSTQRQSYNLMNSDTTMADKKKEKKYEIMKTEEEWRQQLTSDEYRILRNKGTEMPFINKYYKSEKEGIYTCAACGQKLFSSETKYHSGSGWPAFYAPIDKEAIDTKEDNSMFMTRTEVLCSRCGSHLGHVFEDGPEPTGLRYCINSVAMDLIDQKED